MTGKLFSVYNESKNLHQNVITVSLSILLSSVDLFPFLFFLKMKEIVLPYCRARSFPYWGEVIQRTTFSHHN
jgi:hypothetical protein